MSCYECLGESIVVFMKFNGECVLMCQVDHVLIVLV